MTHVSRGILVAILALLGGLLTGCLEYSTLVHVNRDGSGTVKLKVLLAPQAVATLEGNRKGSLRLYDKNQMVALAAQLGKGVSFTRGKEYSDARGWRGMLVEYGFKDINTLDLNGLNRQGGLTRLASDKAQGYTFRLTKGEINALEIIPRWELPDPAAAATAPDAPPGMGAPGMPPPMEGAPELSEEALAGLRKQLAGMRVAIYLSVEGVILESNSQYRFRNHTEALPLLDFQIEKTLDSPAAMARLQQAKPNELMQVLLSGRVAGVVMEDPRTTLTLKFQ